MRSGLALATAGAAVLAASGCGSGGRLSHDVFVQKADAVCAAYQSQVRLLTRPATYDAVMSYVATTLPIYVAALDDLKALAPPADDESAVKAWLATNAKVTVALRQLRDAAMRHDLAGTNTASAALQSASLASRRAAAALGMSACATP